MHYFKYWKLVEIMIHTKIQSYHHLEEMLYVMNDTCFHLASLCSPVQNCCCVWGHCFLVFGSSKQSWLWCWWWVLVQTGLSLASRIQYLTIELVVVYNVLLLGSVFFLQFACYSSWYCYQYQRQGVSKSRLEEDLMLLWSVPCLFGRRSWRLRKFFVQLAWETYFFQ